MSRVLFMLANFTVAGLAFWFGSSIAGTFFLGFGIIGVPLLFKRPHKMPMRIDILKPHGHIR